MCNAQGPCKAGFKERETLPRKCPPSDVNSTDGESYYRMIFPDGPTDRDYDVDLGLDSKRYIPPSDECASRAISLYVALRGVRRALKLPRHKTKVAASVTLRAGAGVLGSIGKHGHVSWWRCAAFDPVQHTVKVA